MKASNSEKPLEDSNQQNWIFDLQLFKPEIKSGESKRNLIWEWNHFNFGDLDSNPQTSESKFYAPDWPYLSSKAAKLRLIISDIPK